MTATLFTLQTKSKWRTPIRTWQVTNTKASCSRCVARCHYCLLSCHGPDHQPTTYQKEDEIKYVKESATGSGCNSLCYHPATIPFSCCCIGYWKYCLSGTWIGREVASSVPKRVDTLEVEGTEGDSDEFATQILTPTPMCGQ